MQNISVVDGTFILVWLVELDTVRYFYAFLVLALYVTTVFVSSMIVYVTWAEESLHEPMYIFISNLVINVAYGGSAFYPKLLFDLFAKWPSISLAGCLSQGFCLQSYDCVEFFTFSAMAYDRYLAVGHPLRYPTLMTNFMSLKVIIAIWVYVALVIGVAFILMTRHTFCGVNIDNVYCEIFSLQRLACGDITLNTIYGTVITLFMLLSCVLVVVYSYLRTIVVCFKLSAEASQKATHTLVTHLVAFSIFLVTSMFVVFRYRLNIGSLSASTQIILTVTGLITSLTLNPVIYGVRTQALRIKIVRNLQKCVGKSK